MPIRAFRFWVLVVVLTLATARSSSADPIVLYSTIGPAPGYATGAGNAFTQTDQNTSFMGFQLSSDAYLTSVTSPILFGATLPSALAFVIVSSTGGAPDFSLGSTIDTIFTSVPADASPGAVSVVTATSATRPLLAADTIYFLAAMSAGGFDVVGWPFNNAGLSGPIASLVLAPPAVLRTGTLAAFELRGDLAPIPEPGAMCLFASGSALLLRRLRRQ